MVKQQNEHVPPPPATADVSPSAESPDVLRAQGPGRAKVSLWRSLLLGRWTRWWVFNHFETVFAGDPQKVSLAKAAWLTRRGQQWHNWGGLLKAQIYLAEAIAVKDDYLPAYIALVAVYRDTAVGTGAIGLLWKAKELLESLPTRVRLLGSELRLDQCGGAAHAQWAELMLIMRKRDEAENHFLLALQWHRTAQSLGQDVRAFLQEAGCWVSPGFEAYVHGRLAVLRGAAA